MRWILLGVQIVLLLSFIGLVGIGRGFQAGFLYSYLSVEIERVGWKYIGIGIGIVIVITEYQITYQVLSCNMYICIPQIPFHPVPSHPSIRTTLHRYAVHREPTQPLVSDYTGTNKREA